MRKILSMTCLSAAALFAAGGASANDELARLSQDAKQWVMQAGNFANTRYSTLKQITTDNVAGRNHDAPIHKRDVLGYRGRVHRRCRKRK